MTKIQIFVMCTALTGICTATCGLHAEDIQYQARIGAKYPEVVESGELTVVAFSGEDGANFAQTLTSELQSARLDNVPIFRVTSSSGETGGANAAAARSIARKLGVATVITGTVIEASVVTSSYTKEESVCLESSGFLKCERSGTKRTPCQKAVGQYTVSPQALRVDNGKVIFSETISHQGEYSVCEGVLEATSDGSFFGLFKKKEDTTVRPEVASPSALLAELRQQSARSLRLLIAPYNRTVELNLKKSSKALGKDGNAMFSGAYKFAKAGRMDRACGIYETLYSNAANQNKVELLYNMGVCQEVLLPDEPSAAFEYYAKADQLLLEPDKDVSAAYVRIKAMVDQSRAIGT